MVIIENKPPNFFQNTKTFSGMEFEPYISGTSTITKESKDPNKLILNDKYCNGSKSMLRGVNQISSKFTYIFFSNKNITFLQEMIIKVVRKKSGYTIDKQSETELLNIMREIYLLYNNLDPVTDKDIQEETYRLDELVINYSVPRIISEIESYVGYIRDSNSPIITMPSPLATSVTGSRTLVYSPGF